MPPAEEQIKEHAECVNVARNPDVSALDLLRRGECGSQRPLASLRHLGDLSWFSALVEQLGNPEVQQLHRALLGDQDVRWLEISVQQEVSVRMGDCLSGFQEQSDPCVNRRATPLTPAIDRLTLDVLQDEV